MFRKVSAEAAVRAAQAQTLRRIGQGGLHEDSGEGGASLVTVGERRGDNPVAETQVGSCGCKGFVDLRLAAADMHICNGHKPSRFLVFC